MDNPKKSDLIEEIIASALDPLADWQPAVPLPSVGPAFPEVFTAFAARIEELRRDLRAALSDYSEEELKTDFPDSEAPSLNPLFNRTGRHAALAKRLAKAKAEVPQNFVGGWSIKGKEIDLPYWRGVASYSLADAALLSVGRDPRTVFFDALFQGSGRSEEADELLDFLEEQHASIALGFGFAPENNTSRISAPAFLDWVRTHKTPIDPRFRRMLNESWGGKKSAEDLPTLAEDPQDKPLHKSSFHAHARLLTALARHHYELVREDQIGAVAKEMQNHADLAGAEISVKVIRNLLRSGFREIKEKNPEE